METAGLKPCTSNVRGRALEWESRFSDLLPDHNPDSCARRTYARRMKQKSVNMSNEQLEELAEKKENGEIDSISEGVRNALNERKYAVDIGRESYESLRELKRNGEIESIHREVRRSLNGKRQEASDFRDRMDKYGTAAGLVGVSLMALTLFAPAPYRFASLLPFAMSFVCYGIGYVYDYDGGVSING